MPYQIIGENYRLGDRRIVMRRGLDKEHARELASAWRRADAREGWHYEIEAEPKTDCGMPQPMGDTE